MTRISERQLHRTSIGHIQDNREAVFRYSNEVDTGLKVSKISDSDQTSLISEYQESLKQVESYRNRTAAAQSALSFQEEALSQAGDLLVRAKEIAAQAANGSNSSTTRTALADEAFQLRNQIVSIANSKYQGKYIWGGADDDDPPYDALTYTNPASGDAAQRYVFDAESGTAVQRSVAVAPDISITLQTQANTVFDGAIQALERLGRSLAGYQTLPAVGVPTGAGAAYTFPADFAQQTTDIRATIDLIDTARSSQIEAERVSISGRLRRADVAVSVLSLTQNSAEQVLDSLQSADMASSASSLQQAQTALQAAMTVSARVMGQSIMDYL